MVLIGRSNQRGQGGLDGNAMGPGRTTPPAGGVGEGRFRGDVGCAMRWRPIHKLNLEKAEGLGLPLLTTDGDKIELVWRRNGGWNFYGREVELPPWNPTHYC